MLTSCSGVAWWQRRWLLFGVVVVGVAVVLGPGMGGGAVAQEDVGPVSDPEGAGIESANTWVLRPTEGHSPGRRNFHACTQYRNRMFVFGGLHVISDTDSGQIKYRVTNDLWMYFPDFKRWRNITQGGPTWPYPRFYHTANSINVGGKQNMVIFGGIDNSHVWTYNYESEEFNLFSPGAISPTPRMLHSSTSYNDTLYIYGGCAVPTGEVPGLDLCEEGSLGDVWRWTAGNGWEELLIAHPRIHRFSAAMFFYRGSLHMLGGFPHVSAFDHDTDADVNHYRLPLPTDWALADTPPPTWQAAITPETARPFEDVFDPDLDALSVDPFLLFNDTIRSLSFNVLPPRLGFASITQVSDDTFLLIAGRSSALTAPSNKVFRFNGQNMTWDVLDENRFDTNIARRSGHCSVATTAGSVLTFAGAAPLSFFSDVASFEAESQSWAEPLINTHPLTGIFPAGVTYKNYYVLHGGLSFARSEASSHVFLLDLSTRRWVNVWLHNQPPVRRYGHSVNVVGNNLYYFGGATALSSDPTAISNAIFRINMDEFNIYHDGPGITELRPHRRTRHSSVYFNVTHSLYVFGGRSHFSTYCDLWRFDIAGNFWQPLGNCTDNQGWPPARSAHVAFILDDFMYIYGGTGDVNVLADTYADVWRYDLTAQSWQHVADASPAGPRFSASVTPLPGGKKVIIALGIDNLKRGVSRLDLWDVHHVDNATSGDLDLEWTRLHVRNPIDRYAHAAGFHRFFRVFSGRRGILEDLQGGALEMEETALRLGCNVGSFSEDFLTIPCQPCPVGTFADFPGQESCFACPGKSTTLEEGSVSVTNCSVCEPNSCRGNGRCTIDQNGFRPSCFCNFGYSGADCSVNWLAIVLGTVLGGGSIVAIVFLTIRYFRRTIVQAKNDSALHQKLLAESQIELSLLERAWEIDVEDLTLYEQIGEGGYGEVYRALWNESVVALKKLRTAMAMLDSFFVDEFQTEVRLQRTLRHRNVVLFFGAGVFPDGNPFLVTEYMRRGSLQQVLASAWPGGVDRNDDAVIETINPDDRLSWGLRLQFARDAARGMTFLHEQIPPRLHRDIKSANFLVSDGWTVKVADFGTTTMIKEYRPGAAGSRPSSFALNDRAELTMGVGTICWCAPEVLSGSSQYGLPSDVYSFAILLFEIETCRLPYEDIPSVRTIPSLVISGTRPTLPEPIVTRPYAREFREIMAQCWDGEPSKRPAFREVLEVLERLEVDVVLPSFPDDSAKAASQGVPDHAMHSGTHDSNNSKSGKGGSGVDGGQLPSVLPPDVRHRRADKYHTLTPSFSPHSTM